jgi:hypothetical protein
MKVAVVYSGEPRSYDSVINQHQDQFLEGLDYDTYHSTWTKTPQSEIDKIVKAKNFNGLSKVNYYCNERPDLWHFENLLLRSKQNHPIFMLGRIQYMTSMAFEPVHSNSVFYDIVVRLRYDFEYEGKLKDYLPLIQNSNDIVVTRKMGGKSSPINIWDGFAFGSYAAMTWYFHFHRWIPFSLFNKDVANWKFQPEFVYGTYLRHLGMNVIESDVQPIHVYPDNKTVDDHRVMRTVQYYRDLATFHKQFYKQKNGKLIIENDSPWVPDSLIIETLDKEGYTCDEVQ